MGKLNLTDEQINAIKLAHSGETFVLDACAGSGKTTTARQMCEAIDGRVLYLVYNSAASADAKKSFPRNAKVSTTSALAWAKYPEYQDRMRPGSARVRAKDTAALVGLTQPLPIGSNIQLSPVTIASWALETIEKFCYSADPKITEKHVPNGLALGIDGLQEDYIKSVVAGWATKIWTDAIKVESKHRFTFDYAFKLMVISPPNLGYDTVIIDEAQDSNDATLHLLRAQIDSQLIAVGDPAQQLYKWRGASDIMGKFTGERLQLSKSFRFGERIADEAMKWLEHTGTGITVVGNESMDSVVTDEPIENPDAILCRNNATVMGNAIQGIEDGKRVAIVGGVESLRNLAFAAQDLMNGKKTSYPELAAFADWGEVMEFTNEPGGGDLKALVALVNEHKPWGILDACKQIVPEKSKPDLVVSTAHKSKGREWMNVTIGEDFKEPQEVEDPITHQTSPGPILKEEAMLHYVTATRARKVLYRGGLSWVDRYKKIDKTGKQV